MGKLSQLIEAYKSYRDEESIVIYQMGKVASTTLENSVQKGLHIHSLFGNQPCPGRQLQKRSGMLWLQGQVLDAIRRYALRQRQEVRIISLMRDPVGRNVSMFFQDLPFWLYDHIAKIKGHTRVEGYEIINDSFRDTYDHLYFDSWFDREIKALTGVDIFDYSFDKQSGYLLIEAGKWKILLLTMEKLGQNEAILSEFCQQPVKLQDSNVAEKKWYSPVIKQFREEGALTPEYARQMYATRTARFFYDDAWIADKTSE